ncbi:MAG: UTP--glucose-phosphate uridylyltransferase, partial [Solirubrobacteraceae bacterium]|nr:UTP--glucose-phosphate uridylyltransferase [Solirubrobacteraceae bacterium]
MTTAVVPVAGLGTRLLPATQAVPKELLPVGGRPVVEHVVEELARSGIERVVFVTSHGKGAIEDHFAGADGLGVALAWTIQPAPRGLGDAVLCADGLTGHDDEPFAVALGDAILGTREPHDVVARLARAREEHDAACAIAVREVPRAQTGRYGIVSTDGAGRVTGIVEKPDPGTAPSTLAVSGRYVMTRAIFGALRATPLGARGELELTDAIA